MTFKFHFQTSKFTIPFPFEIKHYLQPFDLDFIWKRDSSWYHDHMMTLEFKDAKLNMHKLNYFVCHDLKDFQSSFSMQEK